MSETTAPRHPLAIALLMKRALPAHHEQQKYMDWLIDDLSYKAPEQAGECWIKLQDFVNSRLGLCPPAVLDEGWKVKIVSLLIDKDEEWVKGEFGPKAV